LILTRVKETELQEPGSDMGRRNSEEETERAEMASHGQVRDMDEALKKRHGRSSEEETWTKL
jgi:hypothetical protein